MALPPLYEGLADKVPGSLADLRGPAEGVVALPPHLVWSGLTEFDLSDPRLRMTMYRIVITAGRRADYETYLNPGLLAADWPLLRRALGLGYRDAWERRLPLRGESAP
ncbi:hypothetical protein Nocox_08465 [Nonomuraea coxensis DSM 45129]|uniref:Transcriptional regulator n=1 Tax=Nonomuraea coxensis DSM 45129 TaxID=1122611 RepID=A0ABX8TVA5_9ACTN|nr:hypothetical protein [Nonomuraea coxensis]QYC39317.1 hypothetical protein Nocox_08465 [Nonomuraea coxensis DSM 45129]